MAAEKGPLLKLLQQESVGIIPEGVAGILEGASPDVERLYIKHRKGFVRVAIQAGAGAASSPFSASLVRRSPPPRGEALPGIVLLLLLHFLLPSLSASCCANVGGCGAPSEWRLEAP